MSWILFKSRVLFIIVELYHMAYTTAIYTDSYRGNMYEYNIKFDVKQNTSDIL